jgi:predicted nucleic acid-binding protein
VKAQNVLPNLAALKKVCEFPEDGDWSVNEMVLVDTSIWVDHFRFGNNPLTVLLDKGHVMIHPFIIGELACGNISNRIEILTLLRALPMINIVDFQEILVFVETNRLMGKGLGYIDMHLLASAILTNITLWTSDKALFRTARDLGIGYNLP